MMDIAVSSSGVYVIGTTSIALTRPVQGYSDAFIRKYTFNGAVAWTRQFGIAAQDTARSVAVDGQGNAYVGGDHQNGDDAQMFIYKYGPNGNLPWVRRIDYPRHQTYFDGEYYRPFLAVSGSDLYVGVDHRYAQDDGIEGSSYFKDLRVLKFTTSGTQVWERAFGEKFNTSTAISDLAADSRGVVFIGASYYDFDGLGADAFVYKLNPSGNDVWLKAIGLSEIDTAAAAAVRPDAEVYMAGEYAREVLQPDSSYDVNAFVRRINSLTGAPAWTDK